MVLQGAGLAGTVEVLGFDWRGGTVPFPILSSDEASVTVEVPAILTSWHADYRSNLLAVTPEGATVTLPLQIAVVEGFASTDDFSARAFRVTPDSSLAMSQNSGGGLLFYVESGASLSVGGGGGSHLFFVENGGTLSFPGSSPPGRVFAAQGALLSGLSENPSGVTLFPALSFSNGIASPQIYPAPQFDLPSETEAVLGKAWAESLSIERFSPAELSWEVTGLPEGIHFNGSNTSAAFSGIPGATGDFEVLVTASIEYPGFVASLTRETLLSVTDAGVPLFNLDAVYELASGEEIELILEASHNPTAFTAIGLPPGLTLDAETGVISGIATQPGTYTVQFTATTGDQTGEAVATLLVDQAPLMVGGFEPGSGVTGDAIAVHGSGFSGTEKVLLIARRNQIFEAEFAVIDDTELEVILPFLSTDHRVRYVARMIVLTATEATVTDQADLSSLFPLRIIESGNSYNTGGSGGQLIYLKSGATGIWGGGGGQVFFVEGGATLNLASGGGGTTILAAAGATISGEGSVQVIEVPSLSISDVDAMLVQYPLPELSEIFGFFGDSVPTYNGVTGSAFFEDFHVLGVSPLTGTVSVDALGLPSGMSISMPDSYAVEISGIPEFGGLYETTILLSNSFGTNPISVLIDIENDWMPKFQPIGQVQVEVGDSVHIQPDLFNPPEVMEVENLPAGLVFNPFTGEISGVPSEPGFYTFTVVAANAHGEARLDISLQVGESELTITRLPEAAPEGAWVDMEGSGFSSATQVLAVDPWRNSIRETEFEVLGDTLLRFRVPEDFRRIHERGVHLVVVTAQAAVATVSPAFHEVTATSSGASGQDNLVRTGGRIEGGGGGLIAYLENGAELAASGGGYLVFAENGALAQMGGGGGGHTVIYATGATIQGTPSSSVEVPSLHFALVEPLIIQQVPVLTGPAAAQGFVNLPFTHQLQTGSFPTQESLVFSAASLPTGLEIDPQSGLIFGRPTSVGTFKLWLEIQNENGASGRAFSITVMDPFEAWRTQNFGHLLGGTFNPMAAPETDIYGDGFSNLGRYGFALNPTEPAHGVKVVSVDLGETAPPDEVIGMAVAGDAKFAPKADSFAYDTLDSGSQTNASAAEFSYRRIRADGIGHVSEYRVGDLTYVAEISPDLVRWNRGPDYLDQAGPATDNGDGSETVTVRSLDPDADTLFFRVRLVRD